MRKIIKCENDSKVYRKIKPRIVTYNEKTYSKLFESEGISYIVELDKKMRPFGVIQKVESSNIYLKK
jgi:hypothetical protein